MSSRSPYSREQVLETWQQTMRQFLTVQQQAVDAVFGGRSWALPVDLHAPSPSPPPDVPARSDAIGLDRFLISQWSRRLAEEEPSRIRLQGVALLSPASRLAELKGPLEAAGLTLVGMEKTADRREQEQWLDQVRKDVGPIRWLIHLSGMQEAPWPSTLEEWHAAQERDALSLFRWVQLCAPDLEEHCGRVLAFSAMAGGYGRTVGRWRSAPTAGAAPGLLKTFQLEHPRVSVRTVDLDDQAATDLPGHILRELGSEDAALEVGWVNRRRIAFEGQIIPIRGEQAIGPQPQSNWVVLATGGARGITAGILEELVQPGMTLVLVGRSPLPEPEEEASRQLTTPVELKKHLFAKAQAAGEKVTPVEIERRLNRLLGNRDIARNLAQFQARGVKVEYEMADVASPDQLPAMLEAVYARHGRIDAVLHGAGVIEDRRFLEKSEESFQRVFRTKVDSAWLLARHLRFDSLKWLALFGSIAGRSGNIGQCDYAAANEVVNRLGWWLHHSHPLVKVSVINWGPWASGMASEAVQAQFRARGVIPIPMQDGARHFVREMRFGSLPEVESIAGTFLLPPAGAVSSDRLPLLKHGVCRTEDRMEWDFTFDPALPFLDHHRIDGVAVFPAAFAFELAAESVQALCPDGIVTEGRDHQVLNGFRAEGEQPIRIRVKLQAIDPPEAEISGRWFRVELWSDTQKPRVHYRTILRVEPEAARAEAAPPFRMLPTSPLEVECANDHILFHGPALQMLQEIEGLDQLAISGRIRDAAPREMVPELSAEAEWLFAPALMDGTLQACLCWSTQITGSYALPARLGRIRRWGGPLAGEPGLRFFSDMQLEGNVTILSAISVVDRFGHLRLKLDGVRNTRSKALLRVTRDEA